MNELADLVPEMPPVEFVLRVGERLIVVSKLASDLRAARTKAAWRVTQGARVVEIEGDHP